MIIRTQAATPSSSTLSQATTSASSSPRGGILLRPHLWNITPWHSNGKHNISKDIARHCACPETRPCTDSGSTEIYFYSTWCQVLHSCQGLASDHADLSQTQYGAHSPWWHNSGLTCHHQAPNPCQPHMCASNPCPQSKWDQTADPFYILRYHQGTNFNYKSILQFKCLRWRIICQQGHILWWNQPEHQIWVWEAFYEPPRYYIPQGHLAYT